ncbi:Fdx-1, partial [Pasteurella multocida subsp. multocida str. Anand1_cattle]
MPKVVFLPHEELCPEGLALEVAEGENLLDAALD